jgi:hypothetical protein
LNWDAIGAIAEAVGAAGVIATLVYLATQIRQAERTTRASMQLSSTLQGIQMTHSSANPDHAPLILKGCIDFNTLSLEERLRFSLIFRANFWWYEEVFHQARQGGVASEFWEARQRTLHSLLQLPGIQAWWRVDQSQFTDEFQTEVTRQLAA